MTTIATEPETTMNAQPLVISPDQSSDSPLPSDAQDLADTPGKPPCTMQFCIKQEDFLGVLIRVMKVASVYTTVPILAPVFVATRSRVVADAPAHVMFTCSNLETTISFEGEGAIEHEGTWTIPVKPLFECVKTFSQGKRVTVERMTYMSWS